jgi:CHAT domain
MMGQSSGIQACFFIQRRDEARDSVAATVPVVASGDAHRTNWALDWRPPKIRPRVPSASGSRPSAEARARSPRRERAPGARRSRHVILFLAANPSDNTRLALDAECAAIEHELRMTLGRDDFDFRSKWAVNVDEMMRHLNECRPTIVHFSGHGGPSCGDGGATRDAGIHLQDNRRSQHVSERALAQMIASAAPSTRVVVLNACFSDVLAESLRNLVDCVVGMSGAISDDAARSFAVGFYRALGYWRSIGNAIAQAIATLAAKRLPDEHIPVCRTRDGVNADQLFLPKSE